MPPLRPRRRAALVASFALMACASPQPGTPRMPGATADAADREARAAWLGLPSTANGCADLHDDFPAGGLATFYCHAQSLLTLERLEQLAGIPATRPAPPGALSGAFRHYDPRFVEWLRGALVPARRDPRFRERTQPVYDRYVAPLARQYLITRRLLTARRDWTAAEVRWVRHAIEGGSLPERWYQRRYATFAPPTDAGATIALDRSVWDPNVGPTAVAFWLRRELDGSASAFASALEELVAVYDPEWLRAGAGVVAAAPPASLPMTAPSPAAVATGAVTIARLWEARERLAGQKVRLVATVVSAPHDALGTSWFRVADGSGSRLNEDDVLLVTSNDAPAQGTVVVIEGTVGVNRDFGTGTTYPLLVEEARVVAAPDVASVTPVADPLTAAPPPDATPRGPAARLCGAVVEQLPSPPYAYLRLSTAAGETWVALPARRFTRGERVCVADPTPMTGFASRALKRTFARIYFGREDEPPPLAPNPAGDAPRRPR